jgi:hypothetical protein
MVDHATGTFEVKLLPTGTDDVTPGSTLGRMSIEKTFHGDIDGTSRGEMMTAMTPTEGSAGYVAIERVTGSVHGRAGSFVLQHGGVMNRGTSQLTILVVPDSGTGALAGPSGRMAITIENGVHSYDFHYSLPEPSE